MTKRRPFRTIIEKNFRNFRKSQRRTIYDVVQGLLYRGRLECLPRRPNRLVRYDDVRYHKHKRVRVSLVVTHAEPAPEPWYLLTNVGGRHRVVSLYRKRMWIEESFRDAKSGLRMHDLRLSEPSRYERVMILIAIVMTLNILTALVYRQRYTEDDLQLATKRRTQVLSVFKLGMELILLHGLPKGLWRVKLQTLSRGL